MNDNISGRLLKHMITLNKCVSYDAKTFHIAIDEPNLYVVVNCLLTLKIFQPF
jgi:hypothetical protein